MTFVLAFSIFQFFDVMWRYVSGIRGFAQHSGSVSNRVLASPNSSSEMRHPGRSVAWLCLPFG